MKYLETFIDAFWVAGFIWLVLYAIEYFQIPFPIETKDTLYILSDVMDYWFYINCIIGPLRFIKRYFHDDEE